MKNTWIGQPLEEFGGWTADYLEGVLRNKDINQLRIAAAWVKRSGLSRIGAMITDFRKRGGRAEVIIGIDEGGATRQGLSDALALFDDVRIFHDPGRRTFHPKIYLAWGDEGAAVIVGSNNVTAGGLYTNYEASLLCEINFTEDGDETFLKITRNWYERIKSDAPVCLPLTDKLFKKLINDPSYRIGDEEVPRRRGPDGSESITTDTPKSSVFGRSQLKKRAGIPRGKSPKGPAKASIQVAAGGTAKTVIGRWWRKLSPSDAQHPPNPATNLTHQLKLNKSVFDIDHTTYFRQVFFGSAAWASQQLTRGVLETAVVPFDMTLAGRSLGIV